MNRARSKVNDYLISVQIRDSNSVSGSTTTHDLSLQSDQQNLNVLLKTFDAMENIIRLTIHRTTTLSPLTKLHKITRAELGLTETELTKLS